MVLTAKGKLYQHPRSKTMYLTLPSKITTDSQFPFNVAGEEVNITIDENSIIITRIKGGE